MFINKPFSRRSGSCTPIFASVASPKMSPIILLLLFASYFSNCNAYAAQAELEKASITSFFYGLLIQLTINSSKVGRTLTSTLDGP